MHGDAKNPKFSPEASEKIKWHLSRYPSNRAAVLPALHIAQQEFGWLSDEVMLLVAKEVGVAPVDVLETATFYTMYHKKPAGKHCIWFCTNISCYLNGADELLGHIEKKLGIKAGQTTPDGKYSLFEVECLANCDKAPTAQIGDDYHDNLSAASVDKLIDSLP